jgi:hypothetical protein
MKRAPQLIWLLKAALTAAVALLLCAVIVPAITGANPIQVSESDGEAAPALIEYQNEPIPQTVLVGTSLTYRLQEPFFLPLKVRNLAIPGRSILTGLEIVASYPTLPANIFVETNVMTWSADEDFVRKFSHRYGPRFEIEPPLRALIGHLENHRVQSKRRAQVDENILNQPPAEYDNNIYVERAKAEWSGHGSDAAIKSNIDAVAAVVKAIEARGSKVYFFELPLAPGMADTALAVTTRTAFHQRFNDSSRWLPFNYPVDQLRFRDHAHLDERSALVVARAMRASIAMVAIDHTISDPSNAER